ncbi:DegT/DnrJ/EryC1/StrS family aminotransferase [bacterium]|nr:DegT/DnrJ/EryC1/StrS family aminotransferase [bacterium]
MEFIDLKKQYNLYKRDISNAVFQVFEHGRYINGPEVKQLEDTLSVFCGVKHCIGIGSGTHSLEIALRALGIGAGDEVITVPFTWISTAEVISLVGAKPVFVDINPNTYNLDHSLIKAALSSKTKAIMPVSLFGQIPEMEKISQIASEANIPIIEDGAQSFGATRYGVRSCGITTVGSTSFFPAKPFGCYGDGGALFTNDDNLADEIRAIRSHGGLKRHHHTVIGTNGRLDTIQAATLLAKFPYFENEIKERQKIGREYTERLSECCTVPLIAKGNTHVYAQYTLKIKNRKKFIEKLNSKDIPTAIYYPKCLHLQPVFRNLGYKVGNFPEAEKAANEVVSIPMHPFLEEKEINKIVESIKNSV